MKDKNNLEIFNLLYKNENHILSKLNKKDLKYILKILQLYKLEYRDILGVDKRDTFGCEIELEHLTPGIAYSKLIEYNLYKTWACTYDFTLRYGCEILSPVLIDNKENWKEFKFVFQNICSMGTVKDTCGGHIHTGVQILGNNPISWFNFVLLYGTYEDIIFRFLNGEYINSRSVILDNASPIRDLCFKCVRELNHCLASPYDVIKIMNEYDKNAINFSHISPISLERKKYNTLEFRYSNSSKNPIIWQNRINFISKMQEYCKSDNYNYDIIIKRYKMELKREVNPDDIESYAMINLDKALELCDLVFNNNLDKIYFLRQYIKSNEQGKYKKLRKAKKFTVE